MLKKTIVAFSRVHPEMLRPYQGQYNVIILQPELGDMDGQLRAALPHAHG